MTKFVGMDKKKISNLLNVNKLEFTFCGTTRNRTGDTRIFSPLLYQLSYGTIGELRCKGTTNFLIVQTFCKLFSPNFRENAFLQIFYKLLTTQYAINKENSKVINIVLITLLFLYLSGFIIDRILF